MPTVESISASAGYTTGGQTLTIKGTSLDLTLSGSVLIDGSVCLIKTSSADEITCETGTKVLPVSAPIESTSSDEATTSSTAESPESDEVMASSTDESPTNDQAADSTADESSTNDQAADSTTDESSTSDQTEGSLTD